VVTDQQPAEGTRRAELIPLHWPTDPEPLDRRRGDVDGWGRSARVRQQLRRNYDLFYRHWLRVEWDGMDKIPTVGGALLVANHAGAVPSDAPVIMHGIEEELGRPVYALADYLFRSMPTVGTLWARAGGVAAHPDNAYRILRHDRELALVFPEGTKATSKLYTERYRLRRFGRGGFVEIAMRAGVPVVPIAVIGSEEAMPMIAKSPRLARALRVPYVPLTANMVLFGPLGVLLPFPAKFRLRVLDPVYFDVPPDLERYPRSRVLAAAEDIHHRLQDNLYDMLRQRRSVWFG
jgi:1-acyl-sn-glycerol-3-phosphate acyltransferase